MIGSRKASTNMEKELPSIYQKQSAAGVKNKMKNSFDKQKVYELLREIPRGKVITYGELARLLGNKAWARAVGNALHDNPCGDKYPCYKVVNSRGELSRAYAFGGLDEQKCRLEKDGIIVENGKVDIRRYGYQNEFYCEK